MSVPGHKWDAAGSGRMKIEEDSGPNLYTDLPMVLDPSEAERYVEGLRKFDIEG